jgi:hypothetical protein
MRLRRTTAVLASRASFRLFTRRASEARTLWEPWRHLTKVLMATACSLSMQRVFAQQSIKEITMQAKSIPSQSAPKFDLRKWISCSHWGLFPVPETPSKISGQK